MPEAALDAFAEAAPFGAALVMGEDIFAGRIAEFNKVFAALVEQKPEDLTGRLFSDLVSENSRADLTEKLGGGKGGPGQGGAVRYRPDGKVRPRRADLRHPRRRRIFALSVRRLRTEETGAEPDPGAEDAGHRPGGRRHGARLQQPADRFQVPQRPAAAEPSPGRPSYEDLNGIRQIIARAEDLVRNLLAFARKQTVKRITLNVGEMVSEAEVLLRRLVREDVKLETEYGRNLPNVHVDKGQMEMVMMNLVVNARDAMKAQGGGKVMIAARALSQDEAKAKGWADCPLQGAALIEVTDTGPGIPPDVLPKVFEPFFTTKPLGEGTGLGLSTGARHHQPGQRPYPDRFGPGQGRDLPYLPAGVDRGRKAGRYRRGRAAGRQTGAEGPVGRGAASCSSRTSRSCAASRRTCCASAATRCWKPAMARRRWRSSRRRTASSTC
ncbi:MAG: ATP-binding protein [Asticcacaulis sp.]